MRLTRAVIDLKSLRDNYEGIRKKTGPGIKMMGIVKANAYGHGIVGVSRALVTFGAEYLGVGFLEEGVELRRAGIEVPILVLGGILGSHVHEFFENDLEITVSSLEIAGHVDATASALGRRANVHLKIDTGMERIGVRSQHAPAFIEAVSRLKHLNVVGLFSHFATSGDRDRSFAIEQLNRFNDVIEKTRSMGIEIPLTHMANSGAVLDLPDSYFSMVRPGLMLYGAYPTRESSESVPVAPVMQLKSNVVFIKEGPANTSISYGREYFTESRTTIVTVPAGYGDGYGRRLTNKASVLIRGRKFPVVGTICMDQLMVDVGLKSEIHVGEEVTLLGNDGSESVSAWELAESIGTIPYEVFTGITARVPRVYIS